LSIDSLNESIESAIDRVRASQMYFAIANPRRTIPDDLCRDVDKVCNHVITTLERAKKLLVTRKAVESVVSTLISRADPATDEVEWNGERIPFDSARIFAFQSYTTTVWIIYDLIISAHEIFISSADFSRLPNNSFRIGNRFLSGNSKGIRTIDSAFVIKAYGWPMAVSYYLRNVFSHEADILHDGDVFAGRHVVEGFRVTQVLHDHIIQECRTNGVNDTCIRSPLTWPWGGDDLYEMLKICNDEIDEIVSGLLEWTFMGFEHLVKTVSERDV